MQRRRLQRSVPAALVAVAVASVLIHAASGAAEAARPSPRAEAGVLMVGSHGPAVRALQRELRRRGLRVGVDGRFGIGTRRAVARLQRRSGLRVNGIVDRPLMWWMGLSVCDLPGPTTARGGAHGPLRLGAFGPRVCALQRALRRSGIALAVDGGYGPLTRDAVRRAQRRLGLPRTGVADARLLARLRTGRPSPGLPPSPPATTLLSLGDQGPGVRRLQAGLRRSGFTVSVDGAFGPRTRLAVARLQRRLGMRVNGGADAKLLRRLGASRARHLEVFPVQAPHSFQNDFGAPRHQGPHEGIDVIAPRGAPVVAVASGVVERLTRREQGLGGIWLWLRDDAGTAYYYAHLSSIAPGIGPGTRVAAGQRLGAVGRTGDARGGVFHLHFEMHPAGRGAVNPYVELRAVDPASAV
jgi:peptidoglycan hydrolase-like protein with peptidoglycan-binding domain